MQKWRKVYWTKQVFFVDMAMVSDNVVGRTMLWVGQWLWIWQWFEKMCDNVVDMVCQWSRFFFFLFRCACVYGYTGRYCEIDYRTGPCYRSSRLGASFSFSNFIFFQEGFRWPMFKPAPRCRLHETTLLRHPRWLLVFNFFRQTCHLSPVTWPPGRLSP